MGKLAANYVASKATESEVKGQDDGSVKALSTRPKTLFHAIDQSSLPPHEKSPARLAQEGFTVLVAAAETISRLLSHTVFHLLANPEVLERVKEEILEAARRSNELPDIKVLEVLPWLVRDFQSSFFGIS